MVSRFIVLCNRENLSAYLTASFCGLCTNLIFSFPGNPLLCSCNLLWLRAWLQEARVVGPRCSDGSLLREMRLSRQECLHEQRTSNPVAPGCEAELLSVPSYSTAQVFSQWGDIKEATTSSRPLHLSMAPSPEESEYFYDEYVDYPYNETVFSDHTGNSLKYETTSSTAINKKTSSHYISGDTPVIYAASSKNRTKIQEKAPQILKPSQTSPSPSSSGFTFFGVPLPSLNLNNLWPGGSRTSSDRKADHQLNMGIPLPMIKNIRNKNRETSGRNGNLYPPTEPEIQTGGFVPIVPGAEGGFMPIPNPANYNYTIERVQLNNTAVNRRTNTTIVPISLLQDVTEDFLSKRGPAVSQNNMRPPIPLPTATTVAASTTVTAQNNSELELSHTSEEILELFNDSENQPSKKIQQTVFQSQTHEEEQELFTSTTRTSHTSTTLAPATHTVFASTTALEIETPFDDDSFEVFFKDVVENVSLPVTSSSSTTAFPPVYTTNTNPTIYMTNNNGNLQQEDTTTTKSPVTTTEETILKPETNIFNLSNNSKTGPSTLSAFLIPGGQQPLKNNNNGVGRSTVTKVVSPHIASTASLQATQEQKEVLLSNTLMNPKSKQQQSLVDVDNSATSQIPPHDRSMSWYFMNYNKTNLQPYVDPAISIVPGNNQIKQTSASIFIIVTTVSLRFLFL